MNNQDKTKEQLVQELSELHQQLEKRNREIELWIRLVESSPIGIHVIQDRKFVFVNPEFRKMTGYTKAELLGTDPLKLVYSEDVKQVKRSAVQMLKRKLTSPYKFRGVTKGGDIRWVLEAVSSALFQGDRVSLGFCMDITDSKTQEKV